jgi:hypothetical protein
MTAGLTAYLDLTTAYRKYSVLRILAFALVAPELRMRAFRDHALYSVTLACAHRLER